MANEFKQGEQISIPIRQRVRQKVNSIKFPDLISVITVGLTLYTLNPIFLIATVALVAIREAKDYGIKIDTENRTKKLEESVNLNMLEMDERLQQAELKVSALNNNELELSKQVNKEAKQMKKDLEDLRSEVNRFILSQKDALGI